MEELVIVLLLLAVLSFVSYPVTGTGIVFGWVLYALAGVIIYRRG